MFITINDTHYNIDNIACFGYFNSSIWIKCTGDREEEITTHSDPYMSYYKKLCKMAGVMPCDLKNGMRGNPDGKYNP